jgi:hypothetical protein
MALTEDQLNEAVTKVNPTILIDTLKKTKRTFTTYAELKDFL